MSKSETTEPAGRATADGGEEISEHPWLDSQRGQRRWVPLVAGLLCFLIGLSDVLAIFTPSFHARLHRINTLRSGDADQRRPAAPTSSWACCC